MNWQNDTADVSAGDTFPLPHPHHLDRSCRTPTARWARRHHVPLGERTAGAAGGIRTNGRPSRGLPHVRPLPWYLRAKLVSFLPIHSRKTIIAISSCTSVDLADDSHNGCGILRHFTLFFASHSIFSSCSFRRSIYIYIYINSFISVAVGSIY